MSKQSLFCEIYRRLHTHYGDQDWWPGDTPFEVMVGAILTQNTAWTNVEKAVANLKAADSLDAQAIYALPHDRLAQLVRSSGYFNVKARRLKAFCAWYLKRADMASDMSVVALRGELLAIYGVGPETADDILLYAFERPVFVIDAYTRRIFSRLGLINGDEPYDLLREIFERDLPPRVSLFSQYHALIVSHGKDICRVKPRCRDCVLQSGCLYFQDMSYNG